MRTGRRHARVPFVRSSYGLSHSAPRPFSVVHCFRRARRAARRRREKRAPAARAARAPWQVQRAERRLRLRRSRSASRAAPPPRVAASYDGSNASLRRASCRAVARARLPPLLRSASARLRRRRARVPPTCSLRRTCGPSFSSTVRRARGTRRAPAAPCAYVPWCVAPRAHAPAPRPRVQACATCATAA